MNTKKKKYVILMKLLGKTSQKGRKKSSFRKTFRVKSRYYNVQEYERVRRWPRDTQTKV